MNLSPRVKEILSYYGSENPGVLTNLVRVMTHGNLANTGKMVILPVDQGFEHGPARSFAINPSAYDPMYHFDLAIESGCNAYAAPLGFIEAGAREYAGRIPLILKLNNSDSLYKTKNPRSATTGSVKDALLLGCVGVGYTIYPGTADRTEMYQELRRIAEEARSVGLIVVVWAYARGENLTKVGETAVDVIAYCAQIAAQLGAHIVKVKPPTEHIELEESKKVYEKNEIPVSSLEDRARHVVQSCFNGKKIIIFSGGEAKTDEALLEEIKGLAKGGAFGSIMGRNAFQRPKAEAIKILNTVQEIFRSA
jgi:fructose-bisphosphate aldolase, class I